MLSAATLLASAGHRLPEEDTPNVYVRMYVCMYARTYVHTYVRMYVYTYIYTYVCIYIYICPCVCIYIYMCMCVYIDSRWKVLCIEFSVQCCTLRPKAQDEGPVYGAYETTSATVGGNYSA